jgi:DegV family protein with EDD domain
MMKIALVTDSTADIAPDLVEVYEIQVIPNIMVIDGQSLEDGVGITREEFYRRLPQMLNIPTTSTASVGSYQRLYEKLFHKGMETILSLHAPRLLSGIFNAASTAAQQFGDRVRVIDSGQISMGLGFQVLAAAEAIARGEALETILGVIQNVRERIHLVAMLDTLEYIHRSGRVSWARARLGNLLHLKPFVGLKDGQVLRLGETRTRRKGIARLEELLRNLGPLERLAVLHSNAEEDAHRFLDTLDPILPTTPLVVNVTTVIGTHVGPNGLGFVAVVK